MLMSFVRSWTKRGERKAQPIRTRAAAPNKKPRTRPTLEALEDRLVPTIAFTPQFGAEQYTGSYHGMQNPPVYLIFAGSWSQSDENAVIASTKNILSGPYLSGLKQYGASGTATYGGSWNASSTLSGNPSTTDLGILLQQEIAAHPLTQPNLYTDPNHAPIYVVLSDPASSSEGQNGGYNIVGTYEELVQSNFGSGTYGVTDHMIWVGTGKYAGESEAAWKDILTNTISHELVETISDPTSTGNITPGSQLPAGIGTTPTGQVGDYEPEGSGGTSYGYRLNGGWVAPYWSQTDNAFVVPDGNKQTFTLQPIWNSSNQFNGQYKLSVNGDQLGSNYNDQISIAQQVLGRQAGGIAVTLNGETAIFDATDPISNTTVINTVDVNTHGGTNQVNVAAVPAGVTLNIFSTINLNHGETASSDTVTVGSNGSLANIAGPVNVSNTSGQTKLIVSDSNDSVGQAVGVTRSAVSVGKTQVNYTGVSSVEVDGGHGGNTFNVYSTAGNTPLTLYTGRPSASAGVNYVYIKGSSGAVTVKSGGNDSVIVGNNGSLSGIGGPVNVSNISGQDSLEIDDSNDNSARTIDITNRSVNFAATSTEPAVTVNYQPSQSENGVMVGVKYLTLLDAQAANQIEVDSVGANTTTTIYGDLWDELTGAAANQVHFYGWRAPLPIRFR